MAVRLKNIQCTRCDYAGGVFEAHRGFKWYYLLLIPTGIGLLPLIVLLMVANRSTYQVCPSCGAGRKHLRSLSGAPSPDADRVLEEAVRLDAQRFKRNQYTTAGVLGLVFLLVVIWVSTRV